MNASTIARPAATLALALSFAALASGCVEPVQQGTQQIRETNATMCYSERRMIEMAVESFTLLEGHVPSEAEMVPAYIKIESPYFDVDPSGKVVAAPGGGCTG